MNEYMTSFIARMIFGMMEKTEMLFVKGGGDYLRNICRSNDK